MNAEAVAVATALLSESMCAGLTPSGGSPCPIATSGPSLSRDLPLHAERPIIKISATATNAMPMAVFLFREAGIFGAYHAHLLVNVLSGSLHAFSKPKVF